MHTSVSFRPLERSDFPLLQEWLSAPHVAAWWKERTDPASIEAKYGPRVDGSEPVHVSVIQHEGRPIGWIQWYLWTDFPEHAVQLGAEADSAGIDLAIGDLDRIGVGLGPVAIREFARQLVFANPAVCAILTDPEEGNLRSVRAFEKAGFKVVKTIKLASENCTRKVVRLDRLILRRATVDDAGVLATLIDGFAKGHPAEHFARSADRMRDAFFGSQPLVHALLAEKRGAVVGFAAWRKTYDVFWSMYGGEALGLYVRPSHRGRGVALSIIAAMCAEIRECGGHFLQASYDPCWESLYERVAVGRSERACHVSADAFENLAALAGKSVREIIRRLPDKSLNYSG